MDYRLYIFVAIAAFICSSAQAACSSPPGLASQTRYDSVANKMYYCNNSNWVDMGGGAAGFSNPATSALNMNSHKITALGTPTAAGDATNKTYVDGKFGAQTNGNWCRSNGTQVICDQTAPTDTLAGLSCAQGETIVRGASGWECGSGGGGSDCTSGPVGTVCTSDGAYYVGEIGGARIYARSTDSSASVQWKTANTDTPGTASTTAGPANTNAMISAGSHPAATLCRGHGSQWYVPAKDELNLIWQNSTYNGGLLNLAVMGVTTTGNYYWSSSQDFASNAWVRRFSDGNQYSNTKTDTSRVRCVRR